jgi:hypothetical protein
MTRYYFHQRRQDGARIMDEDGAEFSDLDAALAEALTSARELMSETVLHGFIELNRAFEISDREGHVLLTVPLSDAVDLRHE